MRELKKYKVNIPAGVKEGSRIRLPGKGEAGLRGGAPGDLYVVTRVEESPVFRRKGDNFEVEVPITVTEAIRGADVEVPTLHGTKKLRVPGGTKHGTVQRLRGEGPQALGGRGRGDIHYRFVIDVPKDLSPEQEEAVDGLSKVMNGDPRASLLRDAKKAATYVRRLTRQQGVFMISVAAELAEMHPQTLRMYEDARADHAAALAEGHAAVLAGGRRPAAPDPGADLRARHEPGGRRAGVRARGPARAHEQARARARGARRGAAPPRWRGARGRSAARSAPSSCATRRRGWRSCRCAAVSAAAAEAPASPVRAPDPQRARACSARTASTAKNALTRPQHQPGRPGPPRGGTQPGRPSPEPPHSRHAACARQARPLPEPPPAEMETELAGSAARSARRSCRYEAPGMALVPVRRRSPRGR